MIDHDRLFKELLTTFFVEFLELFLPEVRAYLDAESLEFLPQEIFTDVTAGLKHVVDILVKGRFRDSDTCFLLHVEDQAEPEPDFNKRMFRYYGRLLEKYDLPVYPIALFTFDTPARAEKNIYTIDFPDFTPLHFEFKAIQLNRLNWRDYVNHANPVACALMTKMQIAVEDRAKVKVTCLRILATLRLDPARTQLISGFIDTYLRLNAMEKEQFNQEIAAISPEEREQTMQIMTSWMEEGMREGELKLVVRRMSRRMGDLAQPQLDFLATLSTEQLEVLDEASERFESVTELQEWIDQCNR